MMVYASLKTNTTVSIAVKVLVNDVGYEGVRCYACTKQ